MILWHRIFIDLSHHPPFPRISQGAEIPYDFYHHRTEPRNLAADHYGSAEIIFVRQSLAQFINILLTARTGTVPTKPAQSVGHYWSNQMVRI